MSEINIKVLQKWRRWGFNWFLIDCATLKIGFVELRFADCSSEICRHLWKYVPVCRNFWKGEKSAFSDWKWLLFRHFAYLFSKIVHIVKKANWSMTLKSNRKIGLMVADLQLLCYLFIESWPREMKPDKSYPASYFKLQFGNIFWLVHFSLFFVKILFS